MDTEVKYIGWSWVSRMAAVKIARRMGLKEIAELSSGDVAGIFSNRVLIILHNLWGKADAVEKIRIFAHDCPEGQEDALFRKLEENLKNSLADPRIVQ